MGVSHFGESSISHLGESSFLLIDYEERSIYTTCMHENILPIYSKSPLSIGFRSCDCFLFLGFNFLELGVVACIGRCRPTQLKQNETGFRLFWHKIGISGSV